MYKEKSICIVVPCYNEETQVSAVVEALPDFVDKVVLVDDQSTDKTWEIINGLHEKDQRVVPVQHELNQGVGGAIASGYKWAADNDMDVAVVMAGDNQMDPDDLPKVLDPVVAGQVDYAKGNRLIRRELIKDIPKVRLFGNALLSFLTKIASGYWHISDSQTGYTAINKEALKALDWDKMYKRYGQPNDLLVRLNIYEFSVCDVPVRPVYNVGEASGIKIHKVIMSISWLLGTLFLRRMWQKYVVRDFHPLIFFYLFSLGMGGLAIVALVRIVWIWFSVGMMPEITVAIFLGTFGMSVMAMMFAMIFDLETNRHLRGRRGLFSSTSD